MNSKNNNALKVNAITPYGVTDKPFAVRAFLIIEVMKKLLFTIAVICSVLLFSCEKEDRIEGSHTYSLVSIEYSPDYYIWEIRRDYINEDDPGELLYWAWNNKFVIGEGWVNIKGTRWGDFNFEDDRGYPVLFATITDASHIDITYVISYAGVEEIRGRYIRVSDKYKFQKQ